MPAQDYGGSRLVLVDGAVAHLVRGHHGLIAGCSFASDVPNTPRLGQLRDYVDDITWKVEAHTLGEAAGALRADAVESKSALRTDNMHLNDFREQVYGVTQADRCAWLALGRIGIEVARDLFFHRGRHTHATLVSTMEAQRTVVARLGSFAGPRQRRGAMAVVVFCGKTRYGCKTQWVTHR